MPIDASIPLQAKVPDSMSSLGSIIGVAKGLQSFETGKAIQSREQTAATQEAGALAARQAVAKVIQDPQLHDPQTGAFDLNKGSVAILQADPNNYVASDIISKLAAANNDLFTVKKAALGLADTSRAMLGSTVGALATKPDLTKSDITGALDQLRAQAPDASPIIDVWEKGLKNLPEDPRALQQVVMRARSQVMPASTQQTAQTPGGAAFNTGEVSGVINTNPGAGPVGPVPGTMTTNAVPPAQREQVAHDQAGNPILIHTNPDGTITLTPARVSGAPEGGGAAPGAPAPGGGGAAPGTPPMFTFPPGESPQTKTALETQRDAALAAVQQAPFMHQSNRGVLDALKDTMATGVVGPAIQRIASTLGAPGFDTAEHAASSYDLVGKYLERNALQAAQAMGPQTNMGLEAQIKANGSLGYNPTAIAKITKLNDAIVSGAEAYLPGLEKAVTSSPNQIFAKRQFDQQWASNFDPLIMEIYNAKKSGDTRELADLTKGLSAAQKADLARRARNLELLSTQGRL